MRVAADVHVRRDLGDADDRLVVGAGDVELLQRRPFDGQRLLSEGRRLLPLCKPTIPTATSITKITMRLSIGSSARYGVAFYWIVDSEARTVQAFRLSEELYEAAARLDETAPRYEGRAPAQLRADRLR